ncbi:asparagine synthase-related protein [Erythrobacter sp. R86502]|uniref:asparagine synthase-related protein n=1 Tax=Erythrobacter sp. R86502 TaxID=3093846 RepID=UPI0036D3B942
MSGICAVLRLDSRPAAAEDAAPILAKLAPRGPDGAALRADGPAALGHALLATTPEARDAPLLLCHAPTGCIIAADVRLDNRAELIATLGIDVAGRVVGDGELIVMAYLKWDRDCPTHLLGDFAFIIWDPRHQRLFAARDKVGMRQLSYHYRPGKLFACATDPEALLAHPDVPKRINERRIADFLEQLEAIDHVSTFYEGVLRLPPAHALIVEEGALRIWRYWQLEPRSPVIHRVNNADYEAAFLDVLTEAVRARLRSPDPVGSMLSGGMDSGSVTAIAARLLQQAGAPPLMTFSGVDDDPACRESACIRDSIAAIPHIAPRLASLGQPEAFCSEVRQYAENQSDPFDGNMTVIRAIYLFASQAGVKVMLDGVSGDTTLGTGSLVDFHLRRGNVLAAWHEAHATESFWSNGYRSAAAAFGSAAKNILVPASLRAMRRKRWEMVVAQRDEKLSIVHPALAARIDMAARRRENQAHVALGPSCEQGAHARRMLHPYTIVARERYHRVAGAFAIEPRDPFLDVRLLEFCLTLPPEQIHANGWAKLILRRSMAGMLPDSVRWKCGRHHVGWRFTEACLPNTLSDMDEAELVHLRDYVASSPDGTISVPRSDMSTLEREKELIYLLNWLSRF